MIKIHFTVSRFKNEFDIIHITKEIIKYNPEFRDKIIEKEILNYALKELNWSSCMFLNELIPPNGPRLSIEMQTRIFPILIAFLKSNSVFYKVASLTCILSLDYEHFIISDMISSQTKMMKIVESLVDDDCYVLSGFASRILKNVGWMTKDDDPDCSSE